MQTSSPERAGSLIQTVADATGAVIAAGAITLPWWREQLHSASSVFADLAPIAAVLWLVIQAIHRISHWNGKEESAGD